LGQAAGTLSQDAHFARADLFRLPFADRCFDYVVCHIVLTVLTEPSVALAEMRRVTRAGGVVAAIEPANEAFVHSADFLTEKQLEAERRVLLAAEKVRGRTVRLGARLPSLFAHCGLTDIRTKGYLSVTAVEELLRRTHRREFLELAWIQSVHRFLDGPHVREAVDAGLIDPSDLEQGLRPQYEHERAFRAGRTSDLGNEVFATPLFAVRGLVP
jgi:ubiquinone/menaquinone biosynthesis C-methylase UbiE